jgi:hypothetical protein
MIQRKLPGQEFNQLPARMSWHRLAHKAISQLTDISTPLL